MDDAPDTLVERKFLGITLQQLELRCTSNTVHYVLNQTHAKDMLLTSNELKRVLSKTPKFRPTPSIIKPTTVAGDCDILGHRLIKPFNRFVCKDFIERAKVNSKLVESSHGNQHSFLTRWTTMRGTTMTEACTNFLKFWDFPKFGNQIPVFGNEIPNFGNGRAISSFLPRR